MQGYKLCHNCTAESVKCFQFGPTPHTTQSVGSILALLRWQNSHRIHRIQNFGLCA